MTTREHLICLIVATVVVVYALVELVGCVRPKHSAGHATFLGR